MVIFLSKEQTFSNAIGTNQKPLVKISLPTVGSAQVIIRIPQIFLKVDGRIDCISGDAAQFDNGYFKILGRLSADIIKSGGFKISALEIETHLLGHPEIADCTVLGIPDVTWGQKVSLFLFVYQRCDIKNHSFDYTGCCSTGIV